MPTAASTKSRGVAIRHVAIELFFAVLPLFVLSSVWPDSGHPHPESFFAGPEVSMTACVLYGLALARLQLGAVTDGNTNSHQHVLGIAVISIIPLSGVITSVILIAKLSHSTDSVMMIVFQFFNLIIAILLFFIIGGYGISRSAETK